MDYFCSPSTMKPALTALETFSRLSIDAWISTIAGLNYMNPFTPRTVVLGILGRPHRQVTLDQTQKTRGFRAELMNAIYGCGPETIPQRGPGDCGC